MELPVVALEVVVSESAKTMKGSMDTLAEVSPALGLLVIHELEIRRGMIRQMEQAQDRITRHQQRIVVWSFAQLQRRFELTTGDGGPVLLRRLVTQ